MRVVKVTSKGQVTIPVELREELGITDDSYLEVSVEGDTLRLRRRADAKPLGEDDPIWDLVGSADSRSLDGSVDHDRHITEGEMRRWRAS